MSLVLPQSCKIQQMLIAVSMAVPRACSLIRSNLPNLSRMLCFRSFIGPFLTKIQFVYSFGITLLQLIINQMGLCIDIIFKPKQQTDQRQSFLQSKLTPQRKTPNDPQFTYFLEIYEIRESLNNYIEEFRINGAINNIEHQSNSIRKMIENIRSYKAQYQNNGSALRQKIKSSRRKVVDSIGEGKLKGMLKMQIQAIEVTKAIDKIFVECSSRPTSKTFQVKKYESKTLQLPLCEPWYQTFIIPDSNTTRLSFLSHPLKSAITIEVEDIVHLECYLCLLNFSNKEDDYGLMTLRMEYVALEDDFRRIEELKIVEKQLMMCLEGRDGLDRLSVIRGDSQYMKQTFISDRMSLYPNQYEV